jgi:hypothetical protein
MQQADSILKRSSIICIFGMSLGASDQIWWNKIVTWLSESSQRQLVVFCHDNNYNPSDKEALFSWMDSTEESLFRDQSFAEKVPKEIKERISSSQIHVALNVAFPSFKLCKSLEDEMYYSEDREGIFSFNYTDNNGVFDLGIGEYRFATKWSKASDSSIHAYSDSSNIDSIALIKNCDDFPETIPTDLNYSSRARTAQIGDAVVWKNVQGKFAISKILEITDSSRKDVTDILKCLYKVYL